MAKEILTLENGIKLGGLIIAFVLQYAAIKSDIRDMKTEKHFEIEHLQYQVTELKQELYTKIDEHVQAEIFKGFVYNGKTFSMSINAQINWNNILLIPSGNFPLSLMTVDEELVQLPIEEKVAFYQASLTHKYSKLQLGHGLKNTVKNFTTVEEINNFILE